MDVDVADASRFLSDHLGEPISVEPAGAGMWSRCFGFERGGERLVARFGRHVDDFECDRFAASFARPGLPVPRVHEIGEAYEGHFAISDRAEGVPLEHSPPDEWRSLVPAVAAALETMRVLPVATPGWGGWTSAGAGTASSWRQHLLAVADDDPDERLRGRARLRDHAAGEACFVWGLALLDQVVTDDVPRRVLHCDLINRNVHVVGDTITGVFDWGCGRYGDPLYDVAWFDFWSPWHPNLDIDLLRETTGDTVDNDRLLACLLHIGLDHLGYNAMIGDVATLAATMARLRSVVARFG